jgi:NADPH-dependent glutamate synthase beta subunit-like oxidoreductase
MDGLIETFEVARHDDIATGSSRSRVVIIGAGFGGLTAAMGLTRVDADVTVIDRRNHHLFQPLLYQVATAALSPADIAAPIRGTLSRQANTDVTLGTVTGIDTVGRAVLIGGRRIGYDQLVIATGARESYFGHDDWAAVTCGLKSIEDATTMRRRILVAFERAEDCAEEAERRRLLTFVIIGGGPTGVELARGARRAGKGGACPRLPPYRPDHRAHRSGRGRPAAAGEFPAKTFRGSGPGSDAARGRSAAWRHGDKLRPRRRRAR